MASLLDTRVLLRFVEEECGEFRDRIFSPVVTLWAFLTQVLDEDHSCRKAVARVQTWRAQKRLRRCSAKTGSYCKARKRLPENLLRRLLRWVGNKLHGETPSEWLWKGRKLKVIDGSTISMPDTPENQEEYPQQRAQKRGLGFPIARIVTVFSLATGAALDIAIGKMRGGKSEKGLLQEIFHHVFQRGDLALGDRHFVGYCDVALFLRHGVDFIFRQHQARKTDFRRGERLGRRDHLVTWHKPRQCPPGFDRELFETLPNTLQLRELKFEVKQKGFRVKNIVAVTSLLHLHEATKQEIAELFRSRWHAELDLRSVKTVMQMDVLRCKTPEMVRKEVYAHLIVYNLIRGVIAQAAHQTGERPLCLSFKGALQTLDAFIPFLCSASRTELPQLRITILNCVAQHRVGDRPDRYEPRAVKRRPKPYPLLVQPRHEARKRLRTRRA